jgi:hypothetical protein
MICSRLLCHDTDPIRGLHKRATVQVEAGPRGEEGGVEGMGMKGSVAQTLVYWSLTHIGGGRRRPSRKEHR